MPAPGCHASTDSSSAVLFTSTIMMLITILIEDRCSISFAKNVCYVHISFVICDENEYMQNKLYFNLLSGVYARGSKRSHQSALEMCNLSWTPHSSLEKDNSLNNSCTC